MLQTLRRGIRENTAFMGLRVAVFICGNPQIFFYIDRIDILIKQSRYSIK